MPAVRCFAVEFSSLNLVSALRIKDSNKKHKPLQQTTCTLCEQPRNQHACNMLCKFRLQLNRSIVVQIFCRRQKEINKTCCSSKRWLCRGALLRLANFSIPAAHRSRPEPRNHESGRASTLPARRRFKNRYHNTKSSLCTTKERTHMHWCSMCPVAICSHVHSLQPDKDRACHIYIYIYICQRHALRHYIVSIFGCLVVSIKLA